MNRFLQASLLALGVLASSSLASAASQAAWQGDRVLLSGSCPPSLVSLQSQPPNSSMAEDVNCVNGQYSYLVPVGLLAAGDTVRADFEDVTFDIIVVPAVPAAAVPLLTGATRPLLFGLLALLGALGLRFRRVTARS